MSKGVLPEIGMMVGLFIWHSGTLSNIKTCANINKWFFKVKNKNILMRYLMYNRSRGFPSKYPKDRKEEDTKFEFYHNKVMEYYDWTPREFKSDFIDSEELRQEISSKFGFDNKQLKILGLEEIKFKKEKFVKIDTKHNWW